MKQSDRSKQWLIAALLQLMVIKPFSSITIKDITDKAGVSRLTFYRNFESKEDILQHHYENRFREYLTTLNDTGSTDLEYALTMCYTFWKNDTEIKLIVQNNLTHIILEPFDQYLQTVLIHTNLGNQFSYFQKKFIVGGLSCTMMEWVGNNQEVSPIEMAKEILKILYLGN